LGNWPEELLAASGPESLSVAEQVRTETLRESQFDDWHTLVAHSPDGSVYSEPRYLDTLCASAGGRFRVIVARRGDECLGGVALYERDSRCSAFVSQRLLLYYNSVVLRRWDTKYPSLQTSRHVAALDALAVAIDALGYASVNLHCVPTVQDVRPWLARGWRAAPSYSYVVPLTDLGAQWERVEQNLRRLVKRSSERDGLTFLENDDFDTFYRLHVATLARRGVGPYLPMDAFRRYFQRLHGAGIARLYHAARDDGNSVASQLVLISANGTSHTVCAAGDPDAVPGGAHAFLRWRAFEALAAQGCQSNDLTDAALNPVTHFKAQFGGQLTLSLVLQSRQSGCYRVSTAAERAYWRIRGYAGSALRRVRGEGA
jgi:hypothetical protein